MRSRSFQNRALEIDFTSITALLWPRPLEQFLIEQNRDPDGTCVRLQIRCSYDDEVVTVRIGGARSYDVDGYSAMSDPEIADCVRNNKLHQATVALRMIYNRLVLDRQPEKIIWPAGLYGPDVEHKAAGFWLRPVRTEELWGASTTILALADASRKCTTGTPTGLYCLDATKEPKLREIGLQLLNGGTVRYISPCNEIEDIPRVCLSWVTDILEVLRDEAQPQNEAQPPVSRHASIDPGLGAGAWW